MPYRCRERVCRKRFSVRTKTVMEASNLGYQTWAVAIYLLMTSLKPVSSMKLHRDLGFTQKSARFLAHRLREARKRIDDPFLGPAEADETYMGGKRGNMPKSRRRELTGRGAVDQVVTVLDGFAKAGVAFIAIKENIRVEGKQDIQTKVMTTLFALFAEGERDLISERTR